MTHGIWPTSQAIATPRLCLEPLSAAHAPEMGGVLSAAQLYAFTGGEPPSLDELTALYQRQSRGHSADGQQGWLNWIVREKETGRAAGYVQATLERQQDILSADIAWVIGAAFQGRGYATEAAAGMVRWLTEQDIALVVANIHPENRASVRVAQHLGMTETATVLDGEVRWEGSALAFA